MKNVIKTSLVFLIFLFAMSCSKTADTTVTPPPPPPPVVTQDVYVGGTEYSPAGVGAGRIWKNGVAQNLTSGSTDASVASIYVVGSDVYAGGYENDASGNHFARIWKNGVLMNLYLSDKAAIKSIFVLGTTVYAAGFRYNNTTGKNQAIYWANGTTDGSSSAGFLTDGTTEAYATGIAASGSDAYITVNARDKSSGKFWGYAFNKEKLISNVTLNTNTSKEGYLSSVAYSSTTGFHLAGEQVGSGVNNFIPFQADQFLTLFTTSALTVGQFNGYANGIFASGSDVYIAVTNQNSAGNNVARLVKNGNTSDLSDGVLGANANSVYVYGSDVYVAGEQYETAGGRVLGKYWKNGTPTVLSVASNNHSSATSIFVK